MIIDFLTRWGWLDTESVERELSGDEGGVLTSDSKRLSIVDSGGGEVGVGKTVAKMVWMVLSPLLFV